MWVLEAKASTVCSQLLMDACLLKSRQAVLNYAGGAYIYIRREYASRIRIIQRSWKTANKSSPGEEAGGEATGACKT